MKSWIKTGCLIIAGFAPLMAGPALTGRSAGFQDLAARARGQFSPLPATMAAESNPITAEKVRLGKALFHETRISIDGTVSCARCHPLELYAADGLKTSIGNRCASNPRNAPTLLNAAGQIAQHWIGNRIDVEDQARQSVVGAASFGMPSPAAVEDRMRRIEGYDFSRRLRGIARDGRQDHGQSPARAEPLSGRA